MASTIITTTITVTIITRAGSRTHSEACVASSSGLWLGRVGAVQMRRNCAFANGCRFTPTALSDLRHRKAVRWRGIIEIEAESETQALDALDTNATLCPHNWMQCRRDPQKVRSTGQVHMTSTEYPTRTWQPQYDGQTGRRSQTSILTRYLSTPSRAPTIPRPFYSSQRSTELTD